MKIGILSALLKWHFADARFYTIFMPLYRVGNVPHDASCMCSSAVVPPSDGECESEWIPQTFMVTMLSLEQTENCFHLCPPFFGNNILKLCRFCHSFDSHTFTRYCAYNSYWFNVRNRIKQGGVLSPVLFCIYIILMVYFMLYVLLVLVAMWVTCLLEHLDSQTTLSWYLPVRMACVVCWNCVMNMLVILMLFLTPVNSNVLSTDLEVFH